MLRYPLHLNAYQFTTALISMFYSLNIAGSVNGLVSLLASLMPARKQPSKHA